MGTQVYMKITGRSAFDYVPFCAAGLEGRFDVTFSSMRRSYADDSIFFDMVATAVGLATVERFEEAS